MIVARRKHSGRGRREGAGGAVRRCVISCED